MTPTEEQGCISTSRTSAYLIVDTSQRQLIYNEPFRMENEKLRKFGNTPLSVDLERNLVLKGAVRPGVNFVVTLQGRE